MTAWVTAPLSKAVWAADFRISATSFLRYLAAVRAAVLPICLAVAVAVRPADSGDQICAMKWKFPWKRPMPAKIWKSMFPLRKTAAAVTGSARSPAPQSTPVRPAAEPDGSGPSRAFSPWSGPVRPAAGKANMFPTPAGNVTAPAKPGWTQPWMSTSRPALKTARASA